MTSTPIRHTTSVSLRRGDVDADASRAWRTLATAAAGTARGNVFFGPDMLLPAWQLLDGGSEAELLVVRREDADSAHDPRCAPWALAVPLGVPTHPWRHPLSARPTWLHSQAFLGSPLALPDATAGEWDALLRGVRGTGATSWVASALDAGSARQIEAAARRLGLPTCRVDDHWRAVTRRRDEDAYAELTVSGKNRKELRRLRRRLAERLGGLETVDLVYGASAEQVRDAARAFLRLEASGWKGGQGGAMAQHADQSRFFVEACVALASQGDLQILALLAGDGSTPAISVNVRAGETVSTWKIAYDEDHAAFSPGVLLTLDTFSAFHDLAADLLDSCAAPGHQMAERLHADRRRVVTVVVGLGTRRGAAMTRTLPRWRSQHRAVRSARKALQRRRAGR